MNRSIRKVWNQGESKAVTLDSDYVKAHNPDYLEEIHFINGEVLLLPLSYSKKRREQIIKALKLI